MHPDMSHIVYERALPISDLVETAVQVRYAIDDRNRTFSRDDGFHDIPIITRFTPRWKEGSFEINPSLDFNKQKLTECGEVLRLIVLSLYARPTQERGIPLERVAGLTVLTDPPENLYTLLV